MQVQPNIKPVLRGLVGFSPKARAGHPAFFQISLALRFNLWLKLFHCRHGGTTLHVVVVACLRAAIVAAEGRRRDIVVVACLRAASVAAEGRHYIRRRRYMLL